MIGGRGERKVDKRGVGRGGQGWGIRERRGRWKEGRGMRERERGYEGEVAGCRRGKEGERDVTGYDG